MLSVKHKLAAVLLLSILLSPCGKAQQDDVDEEQRPPGDARNTTTPLPPDQAPQAVARPVEPFIPSEKIDADDAVSFPVDI